MKDQDRLAEQAKSAAPQKVQGEGDYESTRRFDQHERDFLKSADVPDLARRAAPKSKQEAEELAKAEEQGRARRADVSPGRDSAGAAPASDAAHPPSRR